MIETLIPSASEHEARANELMVRARELGQGMAGLTFAGKGRRRKLAAFASLPDDFFEQMAVALELYPEIAAAAGLTAAECRSVITMARAYGSVARELRTQAKGVDDTIAEFKGLVGRRALRGYHAAKRINQEDETHALIPHLDAIRLALLGGRTRRKPDDVEETPPPPPPVTPPGPKDPKESR